MILLATENLIKSIAVLSTASHFNPKQDIIYPVEYGISIPSACTKFTKYIALLPWVI